MTSQNKLIPRISFKGVFIFMLILFVGTLILPAAFLFLDFNQKVSYFLGAGISSTIGMILVLTKIDAKPEEKSYFKQRIILATIVGFATSALMTFVFGGDLFG